MVKFEQKFDASIQNSANKITFKKLMPLFIITSLLLILLGLININFDYGYSLFMILFGLLFIPLILLFTKITSKKINKSTHALNPNTVEIFEFYDDYFIIKQSLNDEYEAYTKAKYIHFYHIIEDKTDYYCYINKHQMHIVHKDSLKEGSLEELNNIFIKNIPLNKLKLIAKQSNNN